MSSKNLVICDAEKEYAVRLAAFLDGKRELAFQVKVCSSTQEMQAVRKETGVELLLVSEEYYSEIRELPDLPQTIVLASEKFISEKEAIFKYQSGEDIYAKLIQLCAEKEKEGFLKIHKKEKGRIIGFYSPVRRCGQTALALEKGRELSRKENVLYINLETFAGLGGYFQEERKQNLSVLLYYAKQESKNLGLILTTLIRHGGGVDYVPPAVFPEDIQPASPEEWIWLFTEVLSSSLYDILILDIGEGVQGIYQILQICDEVYMATADDQIAASKLRQFEETLAQAGHEDLLERVVRCDIRRTASGEGSGTAGSVKGY